MIMSNKPYDPNAQLRQPLPSSGGFSPEEYANALIQYGRSQPIRTPGALATNLAAAAINRFGLPGVGQAPPAPGAFQNNIRDISQYLSSDIDLSTSPGAYTPWGHP